MLRGFWYGVVVLVLGFASCPGVLTPGVLAQSPPIDAPSFPRESPQALKRLRVAEQRLLSGQATEIVEELQRILDDAGADLVSVDGRHYQPVRAIVHQLLSRLPAESLRVYRSRADAPARKLLEAARSRRDIRVALHLIDRYFASQPAEEALLLLGDLHFERGFYREAESFWRQLLPEDPSGLAKHPDPRTPAAAVHARIILAEIAQRDRDRAKRHLEVFQERYPHAIGWLAGREGRLAEILQALVDAPPAIAPPPTANGEWTTFAGRPERDGAVNGWLPYYWPRTPTWRVRLDSDVAEKDRTIVDRQWPATSAAFHPIVLNQIAYVADAVRVTAWDLQTGAPRGRFDIRQHPELSHLATVASESPSTRGVDFTLTAADGRIIARLGDLAHPSSSPAAGIRPLPLSYLVGLTSADHPSQPLTMVWKLPPPRERARWEGSPVMIGGRIYAAMTRVLGNRVTYSIAAYADPPEQPLWLSDVGSASWDPAMTDRLILLSASGERLFFLSDQGLAIALSADTGEPLWGFRYPRQPELLRSERPRDLAPPVVHDGRVFLAPADADQIFALDARTGQQLWSVGPFQVSQLLGVCRGRLIATLAGHATGPVPGWSGVRAFDVQTGTSREPAGWIVHDDPWLRSFGRGLVSEDLILWPTNSRDGLFLLNSTDGRRRFPWLPGARGNLAYADGVLLVATPTELWGYVAPRRNAQTKPGSAAALADARRWSDAELQSRIEAPQEAPRRRAEWWSDRAEWAIHFGQREHARELLRQLLTAETPEDWRARAAARLWTLGEPPKNSDPESWIVDSRGKLTRLREFIGGEQEPSESSAKPLHFLPSRPEQDIRRFPGLNLPVEIVETTPFIDSATMPLLPIDCGGVLPGLEAERQPPQRRLLLQNGEQLLAYRPGENQPTWAVPIPTGGPLTHALATLDSVIAVGPWQVSRFRLADGHCEWTVRFPDADPIPPLEQSQPSPRCESFASRPLLSSWQFSGQRLIARYGEHHLVAIDLLRGRIDWMIDSRKRPQLTSVLPIASESGFNPALYADEQRIVVQVGQRRWTIDGSTGRVIVDAPTTLTPWPTAPVPLGRSRLVVADDSGWIRAIQPDSGHQLWAVDLGGEASFSGRPPAIRRFPDGLFVAAHRNHGVEVERIDPETGERVWRAGPIVLPHETVDLLGADTDDRRVYLPADGQLYARELRTGRQAWTANLAALAGLPPSCCWKVRVGRHGLIASLLIPVPTTDLTAMASRMLLRWWIAPQAARLPSMFLGLSEGAIQRSVAVVILDPETGKLRQRLQWTCGPVAFLSLTTDQAVFVTAGRADWLR